MKVIFLDVDGVLNDATTKDVINGYIGLDESKIDGLKKIIDATNADIVLSSSWRLNKDKNNIYYDGMYDELEKRLREKGIVILDCTVDTGDDYYRGKQIKLWLDHNKDLNITDYVIIDDVFFDDFDKELSTHFVNTHYYFENGGLDDKSKIDRAIQILNGKLNTAEECAAMFKEYTDIERGMLF